MNKKFLGFCLGVALLAGTIPTTIAKEFPDVPRSHFAYQQIKELSDFDIIVGYPDGTFKPDENITRAEFATMVIKAVDQDDYVVKMPVIFADIDQNYWAYDMIERAVYFDIVKPDPDRYFHPEDVVTRAQAITFTVNSLDSSDITDAQAVKAVSAYSDYMSIPESVKIHAGKAKLMGVAVTVPGQGTVLAPTTPATRAEIAMYLANIKREVEIRANKKLAEARKPKVAKGRAIDGVEIVGDIATIPSGTILPVTMTGEVGSNVSTLGDAFKARLTENIVTREKSYLLLTKNSPITGQIIDLQKAVFVVHNGKLVMNTKSIKNQSVDKSFDGLVQDVQPSGMNWWKKFVRTVFKNQKYTLQDGQAVEVQLLKPVRVNLISTEIIEEE